MDERIKQLKSTTFNGRRFTRRQLSEIQQTVALFSKLSRKELAQTICEHLDWKTYKGDNRYQSALLLLEQLEQLGVVELPPKQKQRHSAHQRLEWTERTAAQSEIEAPLAQLMPLSVQLLSDAEQVRECNEWMDRYHYLGYKHPIGPSLRYFIMDRQGRKLGCFLFQYAVKALPCRDAWIGWQGHKHKKQLHRVLNNSRFLIFPWVRVKNLASKALSMVCARLSDDWQAQHGYRPVLLETFVDETRFEASSYRAANWHYLGTTEKRSGKTRKGVYGYPLEASFREILLGAQKKVRVRRKTGRRKLESRPLKAADPMVLMWHKFIATLTEVAADYDARWRVRRRVIDTLLIMLFIFRLVLSDNRAGYSTVLAELWEQCRKLELALPQPEPVTAAAMCQARQKLDPQVFKMLQQRILAQSQSQQSAWTWQGHPLYAVDGSKLNLPRPLRKAGYRTPNDNAHYPQGLVSCLYQLKSKIPIDFELVAHGNERKVALGHLKWLPRGAVVVYDRGYYSYEMLHEHWLGEVDVVFRLQKNMTLAMDEFMRSEQHDSIIEVRARQEIRARIRRRHAQAKCLPLKLRLVKYTHADTTYTLATTLHDPVRYPISELSALYHRRWGIEEMYKITKSWMTIEPFHAQTERGVKQELYASFVLITMTRIFSNYSETKIQSTGRTSKVQVNFKNALKIVALNLEELVLQQSQLITQTVDRVISAMKRVCHKQRPNRSYPRQSKQPRNKWTRKPKNNAATAG